MTLLAVCLSLTAVGQLNGRSIFAIGEAQGKDGAFATLVQPEPKGVAGGIAPARGLIGRLLDSAGRAPATPPAAPAAQPSGDGAASAGVTPVIAAVEPPATAPTAPDGGLGIESAGQGPGGLPPFRGLPSQFTPISGPGGFIPNDAPTTEPTQPTDGPTPPVSPVPEPNVWAMWLIGFGVVGSLIRWRRRALDAAATEGVGGGAA